HASRRRSSRMAACSARAAAKAADSRVPGNCRTFGLEPMDRRLCTAAARTRLDRGPYGRDRVSLGGGRGERFAEIAAEFVRLKVDVIVTVGGAVLAAKQATSVIPIVFAVAADPVSSGLVGALARPGGNVTGLSLQQTDAAGKRLELLREVLPDFRRLAIMANVGYPAAVLDMNEVQVAARKLGLEVVDKLEIRKAEDVAPAFDALKGGAQALYVCGDPLVDAVRARINILALGARLPTLYPNREYLHAGGLMSYGPSFSDLFLRAADYVDKILHGAKPGDLPVEQPTKFELVINQTAAKALRLTIPESILLRADEVIE